MAKPRTMYDKIWDDHVVETGADGTSLLYIDRHLVHEVTSPQAFEGLRLSGRKVRAPEKTLAVVDHNIQTTDRSHGIADPESRLQVEQLAENAREFGIEYYDEFDPPPGRRPHHRPGAGLHPAGDDDHLRRQPHLDPRRLRRVRPRRRHQRGRARAGDADADPVEGEEHEGRRRRQARRRRHRQGHHPFHHRPHRHGGGHRPRHRIFRRGDPRAVDGRPDDGLQHVDRGRRARRHGRARRQDLRLSQGPAEVAQGRVVGSGAPLLGDARLRRRRAFRRGRAARRRRPAADRLLGHQPAGRRDDRRLRAEGRGRRDRGQARLDQARARLHGPEGRREESPTSPSTASSSARAPTAASRTCAPRRRSSTATRSPSASTRWSCRARAW